MDRLAEKLSKEDYNLVEELQDQASIAQCEENECHFKIGFSAGLLVQQEAVEQNEGNGHHRVSCPVYNFWPHQ